MLFYNCKLNLIYKTIYLPLNIFMKRAASAQCGSFHEKNLFGAGCVRYIKNSIIVKK